MRFIFKTDYNQDVKLAKHGGHVFWYSLLGLFLVAAPWVVPEYWLAQLTFVLIYAVVGLGLMLLAGFTGLFSLGHAAFLGVGAYTQAVMVNAGVPFPLALVCAGLFSALVGIIVGLPALRVKGIYLGMATLAFGFIVEEGMARWESVTGGNAGLMVGYPAIGSWTLDSTESFYFLCLVVTVGGHLGHREPATFVHRTRLCGHPRFRNFSAKHGYPLGAIQDLVLCLIGRTGGYWRCSVRAQNSVPFARAVQHHPVHRLAADGGDRRSGFDPRCVPRCYFSDRHASADFFGQRLFASRHWWRRRFARHGLRHSAYCLCSV